MPNIVLSRIDERLIHGQVGVQWVGFAGANLVLVANDEVAEDPVQQNLMEMVLAEGIAVRFWTLQKVIDNIHRAADRQKILLVCKTPADFLTLVKGGVPVNRINVGNMHYANGKQQIAKTVSVDAGDIAAFNDLKTVGWNASFRASRQSLLWTSLNYFEGFIMEISLLQAFALGIIAFIAGLDMFNGLTHMHRPVVLGPLVGLVLGDLHTGILTGGMLELVWMGLAPLAGAQPPNVIIGTIVGTAFAITTGVKPDVAVGVAVPFAVAVQMGITFLFSVMSGVMSRCDRMAENADTRGIERVNYLALLALGIFYFLCAFLPIYFGAEHAKTIIDVLPQRLIDGLGVAGGIMPAIGFAVLLKIMMKNVYIPYFILGFVAAAWLKLPVLAIAAAALAMALIDLLRKSPEPTQPAAQKEEFEDGI